MANSCALPELAHTSTTPTGGGGRAGGRRLTGAPLPANLVAHPQLVRGAHFQTLKGRQAGAFQITYITLASRAVLPIIITLIL